MIQQKTYTYALGIDIGSTTVKVVALDENNAIRYQNYQRHFAHIQETLAQLLQEAVAALTERKTGGQSEDVLVFPVMTGSGGLNLSKYLNIPFVQEVVAVCSALEQEAPQTDVAIELGGEDAKILYFSNGLEQRMNGICAGGTGSFIDQMAALLQTDAQGLNAYAKDYQVIYPIAARCGVFAKSDIQPLINEGATKEDLAASIFQAVVNQTISGLACGKPIRGKVAFLGGPLHFLPELKQAFIRTLHLTEETAITPENSQLFAAIGAALNRTENTVSLAQLVNRLKEGVSMAFELKRLEPLFRNQEEYLQFQRQHAGHRTKKRPLQQYTGNCFLGIDAGSTTTKAALIGEDGSLLYTFYRNNQGSPLKTAIQAMQEMQGQLPETAVIARSCATGYGEGLIKEAFLLDDGEVETIAHYYAASFFDPEVDCIVDIGGQDMKCIQIKNRTVDNILLNEACSSGCGSFLENFANSLDYKIEDFAKEALFAENPIDLGTRCTVFMNSNVKQAQKEGANVGDISAGLAYSVIKNALFKVMKITDAGDLGTHVVVQGGTFYNDGVLRSFEKIAGCQAIRPDIAGIMGAFGAALIARERYLARPEALRSSTMLPLAEITRNFQFSTAMSRCHGCPNQCLLTINRFSGNRRYITGNRCEKGAGKEKKDGQVPNLFAYKQQRMFAYPPLPPEQAPFGTIGIPRVLNLYENYPFWAAFWKELGFSVVLSPWSSREIYESGMESIPSESACYPAKLAHGHVQWLIQQGISTIFYPSIFYERKEDPTAQNHFNCPIVADYPENIKNNVEEIANGKVRFWHPFLAFTDEKTAADRLVQVFTDILKEEAETRGLTPLTAEQIRAAAGKAWQEQSRAKADVEQEGRRALEWMEQNGKQGIVLAGRPYHIDPEINHGIPEMIASYDFAVLTEDAVAGLAEAVHPLRVTDQWTYHSRLYRAARYVTAHPDLQLVQLNSFGCGVDAVTTDQVSEILTGCGKLYTLLKIDEVNTLGAARIRIRSLIAALHMQENTRQQCGKCYVPYQRVEFTKKMKREGYTILCPQMSPIHFDLLQPAVSQYGYRLEILQNHNKNAIDIGLKYVNNDACYPSVIVVGQMMEAVLSGRYDTDKLALLMTQTGGGCRASNYVGFLRRALEKAGLGHIPVVSLNVNGMETNSGFHFTVPMAVKAVQAVVYGDVFLRVLYRTRPYEAVPGSANALHEKWKNICIRSLTSRGFGFSAYKRNLRGIIADFDALPLQEGLKKPRVGIVGEILVKYSPLGNNHLVDLLEQEGAEAVVPDLLDFFCYSFYNTKYKWKALGGKKSLAWLGKAGIGLLNWFRKPAIEALEASQRFEPPVPIATLGTYAEPFLDLGNQSGEGWFLAGEMVELIRGGVPNIICTQPFGCLPNHVVGKGVIKSLRTQYPQSNIAAIDYDPGASEVNQLNRIKLMLSTARKRLEEKNG